MQAAGLLWARWWIFTLQIVWGNFLTSWGNVSFSRRYFCPCSCSVKRTHCVRSLSLHNYSPPFHCLLQPRTLLFIYRSLNFRIFLLSNFDTKWQPLPLTVLSHFRCSHFASVLLPSVQELRSIIFTKSQLHSLLFITTLNVSDYFSNSVHSVAHITVTFLRDIRFANLHARLRKHNYICTPSDSTVCLFYCSIIGY